MHSCRRDSEGGGGGRKVEMPLRWIGFQACSLTCTSCSLSFSMWNCIICTSDMSFCGTFTGCVSTCGYHLRSYQACGAVEQSSGCTAYYANSSKPDKPLTPGLSGMPRLRILSPAYLPRRETFLCIQDLLGSTGLTFFKKVQELG